MDTFDNVWALVKGGIVVNTIIIEGEGPKFMERLKGDFGVDEIINCGSHKQMPGPDFKWDGKKFIDPNPPKERIIKPIQSEESTNDTE